MYEPFEAIHMADEDGGVPDVYAGACAQSIKKIQEAFTR